MKALFILKSVNYTLLGQKAVSHSGVAGPRGCGIAPHWTGRLGETDDQNTFTLRGSSLQGQSKDTEASAIHGPVF